MDPHHRKIDLQSPQDLTYLTNNISTAAQAKLDLHIPPSAAPLGEDDTFRKNVEQLVHQYISRTLTLALPSLSINGLDASPALVAYPVPNAATEIEIDENDTSYEPYDPRLATRLRMLHASLEAEITHVAELRREAPGAAARGFVEKLRDEIDGGEQEVEETRLRLAQEVGSRLFDELKVSEMERGGLDQGWGNAFGALEGLRGVTEAVAKLERAERALKEVVGR